MAFSTPAPVESMKNKERQKLKAEYQWWYSMAENDESGSFRRLLDEFRELLTNKKNPLAFRTAEAASAWLEKEILTNEWWKGLNEQERKSYRQQYNPATTEQYLDNVSDRSDLIADRARVLGFQIQPDKLSELATQAQREGWTALEVDAALRPMVAEQLTASAENEGFTGTLGTAAAELTNWSRRNGFEVDQESADRMLASVAFGDKTLDQVKQEMRTQYMLGAFPGWAEQINAGIDIYDLASPYRAVAQKMLGRSDMAMNDPIMQEMMQSQGADGTWKARPLWEAERFIRNTDEWQGSDDAAATYTRGLNAVSRIFGYG